MAGKWFLGTNKYHYTTDGKVSLCGSYLVNGKPLQDTKPSDYSTCGVCRTRAEKQVKSSPPQAMSLTAQTCPSCKGSGTYTGLFETSSCDECKGAGKIVGSVAIATATAGKAQPISLARAADILTSPELYEAYKAKLDWPQLGPTQSPDISETLTLDANSNVWPAATRHCYGSLAEAAELTKLVRPDPGINLGTTNQLSSPASATNIAAAPQPDRSISYSGHILQGGILPCGEQLLELGKRKPYYRYLDFPARHVADDAAKFLEHQLRAAARTTRGGIHSD